jgi:hypothetical protein
MTASVMALDNFSKFLPLSSASLTTSPFHFRVKISTKKHEFAFHLTLNFSQHIVKKRPVKLR